MNRKLIAEFKYDLAPVIRGYNNRSLYINLSKLTGAPRKFTFTRWVRHFSPPTL